MVAGERRWPAASNSTDSMNPPLVGWLMVCRYSNGARRATEHPSPGVARPGGRAEQGRPLRRAADRVDARRGLACDLVPLGASCDRGLEVVKLVVASGEDSLCPGVVVHGVDGHH